MTSRSERGPLVALGAVSALVIVVGVVVSFLDGRRAPSARPEPPAPTVVEQRTTTTANAPRPAPTQVAAAAPSATQKASSTTVWPEPLPIPGIKAVHDPSFGDPFDGDGGGPSDVRVLTKVGEFRLGVTNDSKVLNEAATIAVLNELGAEIDKLDHGRTESYERRVVEYQSILNGYRAKLKPYMEGSFALKGNGWSDTERIIAPSRASGGGEAPHEH